MSNERHISSKPKAVQCPSCGRGNGDWAHLCGHCGASLISKSVTTPADLEHVLLNLRETAAGRQAFTRCDQRQAQALLHALTTPETGARTNQGDSGCVMPGDRLEPTREHLQRLVQRTAAHWLDLSITHPIPWEGAIDAAMEAACNEIRRLSPTLKAPAVTSNWNTSRVCNGWDCWTCGAFVTHKMDAAALERDCLKCGPNAVNGGVGE